MEGNAAREARLPDVPSSKPKPVVTPEQVARLLHAVAETEIEHLVVLIAHTGCRIGEALGAKWDDFDFDAGIWLVQRTVTRTRTGGVVLGSTTKAGNERRVVLSDEAMSALHAQRRSVAQMRLSAGRLWQDHGLAFPTVVGTPRCTNNARTRLRPLARQAGFPASFHALRHFMVSIAAASGVPIAVIAKIVGHKRVSTTQDLYSHLFESDARAASNAVSSAVNRAFAEEARRRNPTSG